jgi:hypothetical protein
MMIPTFGDFLANLAAELSALVVEAWARRIGEQIHGTPREQALRRCLDAGLVAFLRRAQTDAPAYVELLQTTDTFFQRADVVKELSRLLRGQRLDVDELHFLFTRAGYPGTDLFDFSAAMTDFETIFLLQATEEETLRETIQAAQLLQQTRLLADQVGLLREILAVLHQIALRDIAGIAADTITATNVVSGVQNVYQLKPEKPSPDYPDHWESHYLKALITRCGGLDLTTLSASEATADSLAIDAVFTTLYLEGVSRSEDETMADVLRPASSRQKKRDDDKREMARSEKERLPITATEAVAGVRRLVILGSRVAAKAPWSTTSRPNWRGGGAATKGLTCATGPQPIPRCRCASSRAASPIGWPGKSGAGKPATCGTIWPTCWGVGGAATAITACARRSSRRAAFSFSMAWTKFETWRCGGRSSKGQWPALPPMKTNAR